MVRPDLETPVCFIFSCDQQVNVPSSQQFATIDEYYWIFRHMRAVVGTSQTGRPAPTTQLPSTTTCRVLWPALLWRMLSPLPSSARLSTTLATRPFCLHRCERKLTGRAGGDREVKTPNPKRCERAAQICRLLDPQTPARGWPRPTEAFAFATMPCLLLRLACFCLASSEQYSRFFFF
jgi:hypothetical protein